MENQLLVCNSDWLSNTDVAQQYNSNMQYDNNIQYNSLTGYPILTQYYPYYYPVYYSSPVRPIKLTLSEVEKLRKAAKNDKSIKDILIKFTSLIEITVDF